MKVKVHLRAPDGTVYTTAEYAALTGINPQMVRQGCARAKCYHGCEVIRLDNGEETRKKPKLKLGSDEITMGELYDQYLWCRESPKMLTIMKDMSGMSRDLLPPIIKSFEERRLRHG